jgi:hypothetical protein
MRLSKHVGLQPAWDMRAGSMLGLFFWDLLLQTAADTGGGFLSLRF